MEKSIKTTTNLSTGLSDSEFGQVQSIFASTIGEASRASQVPTLRESIEDTAERYDSIAAKSKPVNHAATTLKDSYGNSLAAIGTNDKVQSFTNYGFSNDTLNYTLWLAIYNDSWVFRRAIDKPAQDEVNCGFTLHGNEDYTEIYKAYEKYKSELINLLKWGALFGGAIGVIMFEGFKAEDYAKPLSPAMIKGKRFKIYVTDRWYGCSQSTRTVSSMKDIDYGKPYSYEVTFANGKSWTVHHSFVLRYEHRNAPRLLKMGYLQGWGYAEGAHILNELARDDQLKSSITSLVNKSLIEVVKMKGMRSIFMGMDKGSMKQLEQRLAMVNYGRTYNSLTFLDKDDEYNQFTMSGLSGLSDLMEKNMWLISAALEMQGILYGDLKGGLSQESDALKRYAITIKNRCNEFFRPVLNKFLKILFIVYDVKGSPDFDFISLVKDEENKDKVTSIRELSSMLNELVNNGIISKYQYAMSIKNYINNDAIDINIDDNMLGVLKLEEEQTILDSIDVIGKKHPTAKINRPTFSNNPFVSETESIESSGVETNTDIEENVDNREEGDNTAEEIEPTSNVEPVERAESTEVARGAEEE